MADGTKTDSALIDRIALKICHTERARALAKLPWKACEEPCLQCREDGLATAQCEGTEGALVQELVQAREPALFVDIGAVDVVTLGGHGGGYAPRGWLQRW